MDKVFGLSVSSSSWLKFFIIGMVLAAISYLANSILADINPGNIWGLTFGSIALALFVGAAYYGVRRRTMKLSSRLKLGSAFNWLQFHLYGGTLFVVFTLLHTGFSTPNGLLNWSLWLLSLWVGITGLLGVALQRWLPRTLSSGLQVEVIYERIPELIETLRTRADALVSASPESVRRFYRRELEKRLLAPNRSVRFFADLSGGTRAVKRELKHLERQLSSEQSEIVAELREIYQTKVELDAHWTLQFALRLWLITHLPPSIVLFALVIVHLFVVYYY